MTKLSENGGFITIIFVSNVGGVFICIGIPEIFGLPKQSKSLRNIMQYTGCFFLTGTPQFQYQKNALETGLTETAAVIGWMAVFFLVLKLGVPSEKNTLCQF